MIDFFVSILDGLDPCIDLSVNDLERDNFIGFVCFGDVISIESKTVVVSTLKASTRDSHLLLVLLLFRDFLAKAVLMKIMAAPG